jgi:hypothetical protein
MKFDQIKELSEHQFRRLIGVKKITLKRMLEILRESDGKKKAKGVRKSKLSIENQLLMAPEYIRECRTYFHIATNYGISESAAYKITRCVEDNLIKHSAFALPGPKVLLKSDIEYEVVLIDASESPMERPKKKSSKYKANKE